MRGRVLIVEDDAIIRLDLANILREEGYETFAAANGMSALDVLKGGQKFGLILIDLMMPVMDGWTLRAELLKDEELAKVPVVIISAANDLGREVSGLKASGFLAKPFSLDHLLDVVAEHCQLPAK